MSFLIVRSQGLAWIQVINCQYCNQCLEGHKSLGVSLSLSLSFKNCQNFQQIVKIVTNCQNCHKLPKLSKLSNNCQNFQPDQMSQASRVSLCILINRSLSDSMSEWKGQLSSWQGKNNLDEFMGELSLIDYRKFCFHFLLLIKWVYSESRLSL